MFLFFFFFNDTATTEIYTLSLHDALPICCRRVCRGRCWRRPNSPPRRAIWPCSPPRRSAGRGRRARPPCGASRSEEHTSELQSRQYLVCRLLLEKKKKHNLGHTLPVDQHL